MKKIWERGRPDLRMASAQGPSLRYARAESTCVEGLISGLFYVFGMLGVLTWRYPVRKAWRTTSSATFAGLDGVSSKGDGGMFWSEHSLTFGIPVGLSSAI